MIVSSTIVEDRAQADGRRAIRERHVDQLGVLYDAVYLAAANANVTSGLAARAAQLWADLGAKELAANQTIIVDATGGTLVFNYSTVAQLRTAIRAFYATATGLQCCNIAAFILTLTDAQIKSAFNLADQTAVNAMKVRLQARVDARTTLLAEAGE